MSINTTTDLNIVATGQLADEAVTTDKLAGQAVTAAKLGTHAVTTAKINPAAVTETEIADNAVTAAKIASEAVGSSEIANGAVGASQLANASVGTAKIDSGAATNGQVLSANGSGGASFTSLSQSGAFTTFSATATYGTAEAKHYYNGGTAYKWTLTATGGHRAYVTSSGTVVLIHPITTWSTTQTVQRFEIGSTAVVSSTAVPNAGPSSGTSLMTIGGYGFSAGTAFVVREKHQSSGTTPWTTTTKLTKINIGMTSTLWSTTINTRTTTDSAPTSDHGAMRTSGTSIRYASGPGIWYGGDYARWSNTAGTQQISSVWIVNDVSGSAYSAPFGSAVGTANANQDSYIDHVLFVPSSTAATSGTIHAWGINNRRGRYCTYSVGSASITALSTADGLSNAAGTGSPAYNYPAPLFESGPDAHPLWDPINEKIIIQTAQAKNFQVWDRSLTTCEQTGIRLANSPTVNLYQHNVDCGFIDWNTRIVATIPSNTAYTAPFGILGSNDGLIGFGAAPLSTGGTSAFRATLAASVLSPGTATHVIQAPDLTTTPGTANAHPLFGWAEFTLGTAAARRTIVLTSMSGVNDWQDRLLAIRGQGGIVYPMTTFASPNNNTYQSRQDPFMFSAGAAAPKVFISRVDSQSMMEGTVGDAAFNIGGTVVLRGYEIAERGS